jgi:hypothetical protein
MVATDWWGPVIQTGIGAVAALGGGAVGAWFQARSQERIEQRRLRREERIDREQRRDRAAALLAEVSALLRDAGTHRAVVESIPMESPDVRKSMLSDYERLQDRQTVIRKQLVAMAIGDPSPKVRRLIGELGEALDSSLFLTWLNRPGIPGGSDS